MSADVGRSAPDNWSTVIDRLETRRYKMSASAIKVVPHANAGPAGSARRVESINADAGYLPGDPAEVRVVGRVGHELAVGAGDRNEHVKPTVFTDVDLDMVLTERPIEQDVTLWRR